MLIIVIPFGKIFGKGKKSKTMTMQKDQKSTNDSQRKHVNSLSLIIVILQHIPIAMITKTILLYSDILSSGYCLGNNNS